MFASKIYPEVFAILGNMTFMNNFFYILKYFNPHKILID